jgi:DNA-binding MarR family transcriptional regulator
VSNDDVTVLADDLYDVIGLLRRRSRRLAGAPLPHLALSGAQLELLRVVRRNPGITVAEAARVLGLAPNTVSTLVGQVVALEVVVRERDATDKRVARLDLTPAARSGLEQWRDRRAQATAVALGALAPGDREQLAAALSTIAQVAAALPADAPAAGHPHATQPDQPTTPVPT